MVTPTPLHEFGVSHNIPVVTLVANSVTATKQEILKQSPVDFVLVVDFGYIVPNWLLELPALAPLNIHPSALPRWRGSSPGQYCLLHGDTHSAVTLMRMNSKLDEGPIIAIMPFLVDQNWNAEDYYTHSFTQMCAELPELLVAYAETRQEYPQPLESPTEIAGKIEKAAAYIPWELIQKATQIPNYTLSEAEATTLSPLLQSALRAHHSFAECVVAATKALSPWPKVWTLVATAQGEKRMQLHTAQIKTTPAGTVLVLERVQVEGKNPGGFSETKQILL